MNIDETADWIDTNIWGSDSEFGDRRSYTRIELKRLLEAALASVPEHGTIVEIGVYGGRSLSALLSVAREKAAVVWAADPFTWNGELAERKLKETLSHFTDVDLRFHRTTSEGMRALFPNDGVVDLLHIDGDHQDADKDCELWLPVLRSGGLVVFHDVDADPRATFDVYTPMQKYTGAWETVWWATDEGGHQMCRRKP
jgi:predicted O-methyltransferase YrrM